MSSQVIGPNAASLRDGTNSRPEDLPHGLLTPPREVRDLLESERPKHRPEAFAGAEERLLNQWTIGYYFDQLGHEVIYRQTPEGPYVLAVGEQEVIAFIKSTPLEEQLKLEGYLGY
jgi:hypothetical protein